VPGVAVVTGAGRGFGRAIARRLAGRGYAVLATDVDAGGAAATAEETGGTSLQLDVRDPEAHRAAARAAVERGPLEVWVNNAGVMRTGVPWEHSDDEICLMCEVNMMGVVWGSLAAVEAMRGGPGENRHIDLLDRGIPITVHALCPDAADTPLLREHDHEPAAAINWSGPRLLTADEVAEHTVALLDSKKLVRVVPAWRGWGARAMSMAGRQALRAAPLLRRQGNRHRVAFKER
jgi:NAD(P)-dependent dehydrogenase (short-subunit alcohol dehydrogenase family)